jgi:hypothetical protein
MTDFSTKAVDEAIEDKRILSRPKNRDPMEAILDAARDPSVDPVKLRELYELLRDHERELDRRSFFAAMSRVQRNTAQVAADAANPQTASKYASYGALDAALRPHYTAEGFAVSFDAQQIEGGLLVTCIVNRGAWETRHHAPIPVSTLGAKGGQVMTPTHAAGSGLSYGKRYSLAMAFNIAVMRDEDGNAAGNRLVTPTQLDELMRVAEDHGVNLGVFLPWASERLGYSIENLSIVRRADMRKVNGWLASKKKEGAK